MMEGQGQGVVEVFRTYLQDTFFFGQIVTTDHLFKFFLKKIQTYTYHKCNPCHVYLATTFSLYLFILFAYL